MDLKEKETPRSRHNSTAVAPSQKAESTSPIPSQSNTNPRGMRPDPHYTVFIRLPFPRNDFKDPSPVDWNAAKDEALWQLISGSSGKQLNWEAISAEFDVSLSFLLQQAAWLYERRFESMKAQMKRLGVSGTASPAPAAPPTQSLQEQDGGSGALGGVSMVRTGSRGSQKQKPSAISVSKNNPLAQTETPSSPGTPRLNRPLSSRTPSTTTVTQSRLFASSPKPTSQTLARTSDGSLRNKARTTRSFEPLQDDEDESAPLQDGFSESEDEPAASSRSRAYRRTPGTKKPPADSIGSDGDVDEDNEDDDSGGYLPFAAGSRSTKADPAATLRTSPGKQAVPPQQAPIPKTRPKEPPPESITSSSSSAQQAPSSNGNSNTDHATNARNVPPLSPRHRAELEKLSPRYKKSGSEGSPSMGSSFSDLDDASVTQSALDDAILSNMQHQSMGMTLGAGMGSRISGLRDALGRK